MKSFRLALVQAACSRDVKENLDKAAGFIADASRQGADVVALQELFQTPYLCQDEDPELFDYAEPIPGPSIERMQREAKASGIAIVAPIFERRAPGVYHNSLAVIERDGSVSGVYRKMHIPDDPGYYEKYYFTPGDLGFQTMSLQAGSVGPLICWDQWYPEAARLTALKGASVLIYPTAIGWHPQEKEDFGAEQRDAWRTVQRGHAIANGIYVAAANRIGTEYAADGERGIEFWGSSFICDPMGTVIAEASTDREEVIIAEIDPRRIETVRRHWPFLRDRRIDAYQSVLKRFDD